MKKQSRRHFLQSLSIGMLSIPLSSLLNQLSLAGPLLKKVKKEEVPLPAGEKEVPPTDAVAQALGYKSNIKDVDLKKYPKRAKPEAKNQFCDTCALYTPSNASWGKCQMIANGLVHSEGWCGSWSPKS